MREAASQIANLLVTDYSIASVQYALISDGEMVVSGFASANRESNTTVLSNQTIYGIGSVSKVFTSTAVLLLVDEGKIDLDEPVTTYVPEFKMADERYKQITVRILLNHSSGIMGSTHDHGFTYDSPSTLNHDGF